MIYIPGSKFTVERMPALKGGSILAQKTQAPHRDSAYPLRLGDTYVLEHIQRRQSEPPIKGSEYEYQFRCQTANEKVLFSKRFPSNKAADDFIARVSGKSKELSEQRVRIQKTME